MSNGEAFVCGVEDLRHSDTVLVSHLPEGEELAHAVGVHWEASSSSAIGMTRRS